MARTLANIKADLIIKQQEVLPELSSSQTADWYVWINIFAYAIFLFETIMDTFRADVESQLQKKQPGTLAWYSEKAMEFQKGYTLEVDDYGIIGYSIVDEEARIVKHASVSESDGTVIIKVATIDEDTNELQPLSLTNGDYLSFQRYMNKIKFAGTQVEYRTQEADLVTYDIDVYYDPFYLPDIVEADVVEALNVFRTNLSFNARLYKSDFINAILAVPGVKTVKVNSMVVTPFEGDDIALDVVEELASGYFNFSENSVITMINVDA